MFRMGIISTSTWGKMALFSLETVCVPNKGLKREILAEAHGATYTVHPSSTKMYQDLKETYWWYNMKRDVAEFVAQHLTSQQITEEHQKRIEPLQLLKIPM